MKDNIDNSRPVRTTIVSRKLPAADGRGSVRAVNAQTQRLWEHITNTLNPERSGVQEVKKKNDARTTFWGVHHPPKSPRTPSSPSPPLPAFLKTSSAFIVLAPMTPANIRSICFSSPPPPPNFSRLPSDRPPPPSLPKPEPIGFGSRDTTLRPTDGLRSCACR